jgi:hypothetical protein
VKSIPSSLLCLFIMLAVGCKVESDQSVGIQLHPYAGTALRTIEVTVNGHTTPFLFDTGGGLTLINLDHLTKSDRSPFGRVFGYRADGEKVSLQRYGPVRLDFGGYKTEGEVGVFDLTALLGKGAPPVGGLVGMSSFEGRALTCEMASDRLTVESPSSLERRIRGMHELNVRYVKGAGGDVVPFIEARAKTGTIWLEVDSGNNGPVFLAPHAIEQLGIQIPKSGKAELELDVIGLGPISVTVAPRDMIYDGELNPQFLRQLRLTFDLASGRAWGERVSQPAPK